MHASTSFTSHYVYELLGDSHYRRLLLQNLNLSTNSTNLYHLGGPSFDSNVIMVLSVLLCALIFSLSLNSIIRCVLRCSNLDIHIDSSSTSNTSSGLANTGIKNNALKTFPIVNYSTGFNNLPNLDTECVICLSEFTNNDKVRLLPKCNHGFHVPCIDEWLSSHSSCPKCRHCLIETCHKIIESQATLVSETIIRIEPLQLEDFVRNYRETN